MGPKGMTTVGATEDNRSAEITCTKSQESSVIITDDEWLISIANYKVDETTKKPQIEMVPSLLRSRKSYKSCFNPSVVSIGPYHHGKSEYRAFEKLKAPIAQKLCRLNLISVERLYEEVANVGKSARECYEKGWTDGYDDEFFNRMMFLDACFVAHFLLIGVGYINPKVDGRQKEDGEQKEEDTRLEKSFYLVLRDLFLLENQIPLQVLRALMKSAFEMPNAGEDIIKEFLELYTVMSPMRNSRSNAVNKFLAHMMGCSPKSDQEQKKRELDFVTGPHLLHLMREQLIQPVMHDFENLVTFFRKSKPNFRESNIQESYRSVTDLKSAGIYFKPSQTGSCTDVKFTSRHIFGTLTIPPIKVDHLTKPLLLNLAAYEMCPLGPSEFCITSYICLMDSLIDHADDVKELRKKRILINKLGSDEQLAQLFNEIANDLEPDPRAYADARSKIDIHCKNKGHIWMAEWTHKYFSSPWALLAFLGAILILALTLAQTYFTAYPR
ncbi:Hypothetical predicted protein [Olea europaea subsp. europaea]|uniref:Uncharacterized protein n=1 Tax=Olea europaea subsp. europaea TaxID=158383 RepID=A0A8S0RVX9_OLEEU|nr:Hypothetical predicted protein [Olea europaea subsp. europaea]